MKIVKVLNEEDLSMIVCKHFDVAPSKVKVVYNVYDSEHVSVEVNVERLGADTLELLKEQKEKIYEQEKEIGFLRTQIPKNKAYTTYSHT